MLAQPVSANWRAKARVSVDRIVSFKSCGVPLLNSCLFMFFLLVWLFSICFFFGHFGSWQDRVVVPTTRKKVRTSSPHPWGRLLQASPKNRYGRLIEPPLRHRTPPFARDQGSNPRT